MTAIYTSTVRAIMGQKFGRLRHTTRFSAVPTHYDENVAEHSFWTALIGMGIAADLVESNVPYPMDMNDLYVLSGEVATKALLHDIEESMTGDVVRELKYATPEVRAAIGRVEEAFVDRLTSSMHPGPSSWMKLLWAESKDDSLSGQIVALADLLCVISYCDHEVSLGNETDQLYTILHECMDLIRTKFKDKEIQPYVRQWLMKREAGRAR